MHRESVLRGLAGVAGAALLLVGAWGTLWVLLLGAIAAQPPDPLVVDGDPCCGHPDTWGEVAAGIGWTLGYALVDAFIICASVALLVWSALGRWPHVRRLALVSAAGVGLVAVSLGVALVA